MCMLTLVFESLHKGVRIEVCANLCTKVSGPRIVRSGRRGTMMHARVCVCV